MIYLTGKQQSEWSNNDDPESIDQIHEAAAVAEKPFYPRCSYL